MLPDGSPYGYSVGSPKAAIKDDVLRMFVDSAEAAGVGYGFYYSIMKSFYLCHSFSGTNSCTKTVLPGQHNFTADEYTAVVKQQVTELWTEYGNLTEIWVDSATDGLDDLMIQLQPQAVGTRVNPTGWCGTESGHPSKDVGSKDVWSIGPGFFGDPDGSEWIPKFCDPQLFQDHIWFWEPNLAVRTLAMMIPIYHDIVGRGMVMELAFSIDRDGLVEDTHAVVYKQLGDWVRACYGTPIASTSGAGPAAVTLDLTVRAGDTFDRIQLQEDTISGQRVRNYKVALSNASAPGGWTPIATGSAIGTKRIHLLDHNITITAAPATLRLSITQTVAPPIISQFAAFAPCAQG